MLGSKPTLTAGAVARRRWCKRALDVVGSLLLLVLTAPLFVAAAVAVRLSSPGPVFFRQRRVVEHGRVIELVKFRTFPVGHADTVWSLGYEDCPLRVGRVLRRTSIDELPQLWNVLRGQLSLVGPRPERPHFAAELCRDVPGYAARQRVPGGITGLAQVHGYWGQTSIHERARLDNQYIDTWTLWQDLTIMARTVPEIVRRAVRPAKAASPQRPVPGSAAEVLPSMPATQAMAVTAGDGAIVIP